MGDRLKPAEYGQKVAESVLAQIGPEWNAIKAKAQELESVKKRVPELESVARKAQKQAKAAQERAKPSVCDTGHLRTVAGAGQQGGPCQGG